MKKLNPVEKKIVDDLLETGNQHSHHIERVSAGTLIRLLRRRLFLTQVKLAKLAGISQSMLNQIENGKRDPGEKTIIKILAAMECDLFLLPYPRKHPTDILRDKARRIAQKRIRYTEGTMALEQQKPTQKWLNEMLEHEIEEILKNPTNVWNEDV